MGSLDDNGMGFTCSTSSVPIFTQDVGTQVSPASPSTSPAGTSSFPAPRCCGLLVPGGAKDRIPKKNVGIKGGWEIQDVYRGFTNFINPSFMVGDCPLLSIATFDYRRVMDLGASFAIRLSHYVLEAKIHGDNGGYT